jgi:hypothetical protein
VASGAPEMLPVTPCFPGTHAALTSISRGFAFSDFGR